MSNDGNGQPDNEAAEPDLRPGGGILHTARRDYVFNFFYQWEHKPDGVVFMHVYPGMIVDGTPMVQGIPFVLVFQPDGLEALAADVGRGFRSSAIQVAPAAVLQDHLKKGGKRRAG